MLVVVLAALCMDPLLNTMRMLIVVFQMLIDMMRMLIVAFQMLMDMMRMLMFVVEVVTVWMVVCEDWTLCVCRWGCRLWR